MARRKSHYYLIAHSLFTSPSEVIEEVKPYRFNKTERFENRDYLKYFGKGFEILICKEIFDKDDVEDTLVTVTENTNVRLFDTEEIIKSYPKIEGEFFSGIYYFGEGPDDYYWFNDLNELNDSLEDDFSGHGEMSTDYRYVCSQDSIELFNAEDGENVLSYKRHDFSFFDVFCPVCGQKLIGATKTEHNKCEIDTGGSCKHYIGHGVFFNGYYDGLKDRVIAKSKYDGKNVKFLINGKWVKPLIFSVENEDSYWYSNDKSSGDHFFFVVKR